MSAKEVLVSTNYRICTKDSDCLDKALLSMGQLGFVILENVLDIANCHETAKRMQAVKELLQQDLSKNGLSADSLPLFPLLMHYDPFFFQFIEIPSIVSLVRRWISPDAILRNQLGQLTEPIGNEHDQVLVFQNFHRNFRHIPDAPKVSMEMILFLEDSTEDNGSNFIVSGSHRLQGTPTTESLVKGAELITASAGSILILDGMTWHRQDQNRTSQTFPALLQQFTKSIIKQYFDFPRLLDPSLLAQLSESTRTLLGCNSRVPSSLLEYFEPDRARGLHEKNNSEAPIWVVK